MPTVSFNTHLPDYEVLAELGRGNTRVLKARHLPSGDIVAIKQYAFATDADTLRRFERESQIMTRIDHPNVVRVREVQLGASMPYVVMDFVEGGDLRSLLRQNGHLDIPTTVRLGLQLTGAFRAMHPLHVVHRDIKPENVLYRRLASGELHFLLTDFGIAKLRADDSTRTRTGQSLMTYEYAAPEQFDNPRHVDDAADFYALGVVLYECLTGHVPFVLQNETGLAAFMQQVLTAPMPTPVLPSGQPLPPSLAQLLTELLTRNPQDRLRNPDQMELLLEQSRVEHLKANWVAQVSPVMTTTKTMAGPVAPSVPQPVEEPAMAVMDDAPYYPATPEPTDNSWKWWGLGGLILAAGLAFGLYSRTSHRSGATVRTDSVSRMMPNSDQVEAGLDTATPTTTEPGSDEEVTTDSPVSTESTHQPSVDSSVTVTADSLSTVLPDSTQ